MSERDRQKKNSETPPPPTHAAPPLSRICYCCANYCVSAAPAVHEPLWVGCTALRCTLHCMEGGAQETGTKQHQHCTTAPTGTIGGDGSSSKHRRRAQAGRPRLAFACPALARVGITHIARSWGSPCRTYTLHAARTCLDAELSGPPHVHARGVVPSMVGSFIHHWDRGGRRGHARAALLSWQEER